jgi:uncharacterized sulfatase
MLPRLLLAFLAGALIGGPLLAADSPPRYNLVMVVTDDQAAWTLGCYGNKEVQTPNQDRLAREGARFERAFTVTPVCSPSRATFLSGRYGTQVGITDWITPKQAEGGLGLDKKFPIWPEVLHQNGYRTALVGKWHLGGKPEFHPTQRGFDHFFGNLGGGWSPRDPTFEVEGKNTPFKGASSDLMTDDALRFLDGNADRPFALLVHYREPHAPYTPMPEEDSNVYRNRDLTIPNVPGLDPDKIKQLTREYYSSVHAVDRNLGRILDRLEKLKVLDRTIVMYTSDHGYNIGHHGIWHKGNGVWIVEGKKGTRPNMFDTSLRIPWLVRWPGVVKPGTVVTRTITNLDTFPSVLAMLQVPMPGGLKLAGRDFTPLLRGQDVPWNDDFFGQYDLINGAKARMRMIRTPEWKLVRHYQADGENELYHLKDDPGETRNLYGASEQKQTQTNLQSRLQEWMRSINDPLTP